MASESKPVRRDEGNVIARVGASLTRWSMKYMPDPSIFAVVLTLIAFVLGIVVARQTPMQMVQNWYKGLWELLAFAMQMCLIIITGSAVAEAPIAKKGYPQAGRDRQERQAGRLAGHLRIRPGFLPALGPQPHRGRAAGQGAGQGAAHQKDSV